MDSPSREGGNSYAKSPIFQRADTEVPASAINRAPHLGAHKNHARQDCQRTRRSPCPQVFPQNELRQQRLQTKLADDAGTAKLSGSFCTSAINAKNDTALQATPRINKRRLAMVSIKRANPRAVIDCSPARFMKVFLPLKKLLAASGAGSLANK